MGMSDTELKLIIDTTEATSAVNKLAREVQGLKGVLEITKDQFRDNDITEKQFIADTEEYTAKLREKTKVLEALADTQETGTGFGGVSRNIFKAERAFEMLTTGSGLARAGPMLDSIGTALGLGSGIGFAIVGLEFAITKVIPHLAKMFDIFDPEKIKKATEALEEFRKKNDQINAKLGSSDQITQKETGDLLGGLKDISGKAAAAMEATGQGDQLTQAEKQEILSQQTLIHLSPNNQALKDELGQIKARIEADRSQRTLDRARTMVAQSEAPGAVGRQNRQALAGLAGQSPKFFPPDFAALLAGVEPEARQAEEEANNAIDAEEAGRIGKKQERRAAAAIQKKETDERRKRWEHRQKVDDAGIIDAANMEDHQATADAHTADAEAKRLKREADAKQREQERANSPEGRLRAEREQVGQAVEGYNQQFGFAENEMQLQAIKRHAEDNYRSGASIYDAVDAAVAQTRQDIEMGFARQQKRSETYDQMRGNY